MGADLPSGTTQGGALIVPGDDQLALPIIQIYNAACADRMKDSGDRINCKASLAPWDKDP
jgi:hypothetical protein